MKAYDVKKCGILKAEQLTEDIFSFTVQCGELAAKAAPGQFAQILVPGHTLRRPISICGIDRAAGTLRFVFQVRGEGTAELAEFREGQRLDILATLGNGFPIDRSRRTLLVGGGIGVPPMLGAAAELGSSAVAVLGFRNRDAVILESDFRAVGAEVHIATDDGSYGFHGVVTDCAEELSFDAVFACGPSPMLKAVAAMAAERGVPCWVSLEERMACGMGACLGCAVALRREPCGKALSSGDLPDDAWYYGHVCKDGPVFDSRKVIF